MIKSELTDEKNNSHRKGAKDAKKKKLTAGTGRSLCKGGLVCVRVRLWLNVRRLFIKEIPDPFYDVVLVFVAEAVVEG